MKVHNLFILLIARESSKDETKYLLCLYMVTKMYLQTNGLISD